MAEVDEMAQGLTVRLASPADVRAMGERLRSRRRVAMGAAAVVVVAAMGAGSWAVLAGGAPHGAGPAVPASPHPSSSNPYVSGDIIVGMEAADLPLNSELHWTVYAPSHPRSVNDTLPNVGLDEACGSPGAGHKYQFMQGVRNFSGKGGARARHRDTEYNTGAMATAAVSDTEAALTECGLTWHEDGSASYYAGTAKSGVPLKVTIERYGRWVAVTEVQNVARLAQ
ncbi:hypothetical protein OG607_15780 [Streptomyces sp. NBC_01537]|uniref:hypothetical protein n=1 Tax=Streptomyces sp. NBC_01537 TaxID=2903896 RepID=UPI0038665A0D